MSLSVTLRAALTGDTAVSGLVAARVYPLRAPENPVAPFVTYQFIDGAPVEDLQGETGLTTSRLDVRCWSTTATGAEALADKVRLALGQADKREALAPGTANEMRARISVRKGPMVIEDIDDTEGLFMQLLQVEIMHDETRPAA